MSVRRVGPAKAQPAGLWYSRQSKILPGSEPMTKTGSAVLATMAVLAMPSLAYAYVDPGAGSMLLQLLLGGIAGLFFFFKVFKRSIFRFLGFGKDEDSR